MKPNPKIFLLALLISASANAQITNNTNQLGFKAGLNFTGLEYSKDYKNFSISTIVRPVVGVYGNLAIANRFSVQLEGIFNGLGHKTVNKNTGEIIQRINYISLPVLFKYHSSDHFKVFAGAQWDVLFSASKKYLAVDNEFIANKTTLNGDDFAAVLGLEYVINSRWSFQGRYAYGLTEVKKFDPMGQNRSLQTSFNYRLGK
ncbi:MAG: hypothetical protein RL131_1445 [Bacteroidota bacterium]|jgi:hypothetical protein